ncbi:retropepsin-like aspartic protease [Alteromonas halophila]|uniref:Peptidase A2 domain-containing protein n=1 Tax=Alteromonas halophila TaxID=516698 RepID=A0A918N0U8_9ALTE|nr:retropepsin-like aspartic protease [Alteromonas halophila]GGW95031.1 hypothetical protein GCM10007391_31590 [Alteromonas halophila]
MRGLLSVLLLLSVALNVYLWQKQASAPVETRTDGHSYIRQENPPVSPAPTEAAPPTAPAPNRLSEYRQWLESGQYERLKEALNRALKASPLDAEMLLLEAELVLQTEPLSEAILHYYTLLDLPLAAEVHDKVNARITSLTSNAASQLRQNANWSLLAQFMEPLFQRMPTDYQYARWLAEAYAQQQKPTLTEDVLAALPATDPAVSRIRGLLVTVPASEDTADTRASDSTSSEAITIALERGRDQYFAHVRFASVPARLLFDTGASTTAITDSLYKALKRRSALPFIGNFTVNTAAGRIRAAMYEVPVLTFGPLRIEDTPVLVLPPSVLPNADGLLGMNVLRGYHFGIDQQKAALTLSPLKPN